MEDARGAINATTVTPEASTVDGILKPLIIDDNLVGTLLAVIGNIIISISLNVQKCAHSRVSALDGERQRPYLHSKLWWTGLLLMLLGELGNFAAYGFAPVSLIAPLGAITVIASGIIAVFFLKEACRASDLLGAALGLAGTYLLVTFAPSDQQQLTGDNVVQYTISWAFLLYLLLEIVLFSTLLYFNLKLGITDIVVCLLLAALMGSITVISVKAVSGMVTLSARGNMQLDHPIFYVMFVVMVATAVAQVSFLREAMCHHDSIHVVPINHVFFTTSAIIAGAIYYQEFYGTTVLNVTMFLFGCLLSFMGVFLITRNRPKPAAPTPFVNMDMFKDLRKVMSEKEPVQPELGGSALYGALSATQQPPPAPVQFPLGDGDLRDPSH
ncbi:NIPA-like protein 3 isoform X1 [Petromyzon marinus]|uniref:NIPA-like protein 3 isoform X1 n=1 Tax=Petromyzon marinus TaxID=7757 RepID=UPI003F72BBC4